MDDRSGWNVIKKIDLEKGEGSRLWARDGLTGSEPVMIPRPGDVEEDDGVVLFIANDESSEVGRCILTVLDARTFDEIASAAIGEFKGLTVHGNYVDRGMPAIQ
ncbi:carotenoid oxygenase [Jimgerdemannia flammicorona]|uniref:Carotenoid oxygenase n=1 Tax=Jimgerdemannia flammicorona TaxID=994334 RepID=A0A433R0Q2_9FUNG|nr:carotenoid oxygenase [Jimgerdemannia flammicorona]